MKIARLIKIVFFLSLFFTISSCEKSNINKHPEFSGTWTAMQSSVRYEIIVEYNGKATYEKIDSNTKVSFRGNLIVKDDVLKIGFKEFIINSYPSQSTSDNIWRMILDDIEYEKK